MKVWRTIDNFLSDQEIKKVFQEKTFKPFTTQWYDLPAKSFYQKKILAEIENDFVDISNAVGIEEWTQDASWFMPGEHVDKDEVLYEKTGIVKYPLCSAVLYLKIRHLEGAKLLLVRDNVEITPEPGKLILLAPGVLHKITDFYSGQRISINLNIWDRALNNS